MYGKIWETIYTGVPTLFCRSHANFLEVGVTRPVNFRLRQKAWAAGTSEKWAGRVTGVNGGEDCVDQMHSKVGGPDKFVANKGKNVDPLQLSCFRRLWQKGERRHATAG